tara:strand:+ start:986 stop:1453 length:468 start_codon:yes stop_codon:yes gene_type:complete
MTKFASGKNAYAISDRSGFRYRYTDMRREWNGALVGKDEFERKQPQLGPFRKVIDAQALQDARPPQDLASERAIQYGFMPVGFKEISGITPANNLVAVGNVGDVIINPTSTDDEVVGLSASALMGSVTVNPTSTSPSFDSTSVTLDSTTDTFDEG